MKAASDALQHQSVSGPGGSVGLTGEGPPLPDDLRACIEPVSPFRGESDSLDASQLKLCFTCWSCAVECPVNRFTSRLNPVKLLRMAHLGLMDELLECPDIWYCLSCGRCSRICPMKVKPSALIAHLRYQAVEMGVRPPNLPSLLADHNRKFQRRRRRAMSACVEGSRLQESPGDWEAPGEASSGGEAHVDIVLPEFSQRGAFRKEAGRHLGFSTGSSLCYTCCQCRNACPVCFEREVFDPLFFIRVTNLGLRRLALNSPSLWLCIQCESCTHACPMGVNGHLVIRQLQSMACRERVFPGRVLSQWHDVQKDLYCAHLDRIDGLLT